MGLLDRSKDYIKQNYIKVFDMLNVLNHSDGYLTMGIYLKQIDIAKISLYKRDVTSEQLILISTDIIEKLIEHITREISELSENNKEMYYSEFRLTDEEIEELTNESQADLDTILREENLYINDLYWKKSDLLQFLEIQELIMPIKDTMAQSILISNNHSEGESLEKQLNTPIILKGIHLKNQQSQERRNFAISFAKKLWDGDRNIRIGDMAEKVFQQMLLYYSIDDLPKTRATIKLWIRSVAPKEAQIRGRNRNVKKYIEQAKDKK